MSRILGVRREDKSRWERRVPLVPAQIKRLRDEHGVELVIQPSEIRVFPDTEFEAVGARVAEDLSDCSVIIGVKEMPAEFFQPGKGYLFFSHVIKGQPYNMPMLRRILDVGSTLIDYEKIADDEGRRLIAFGRFAGLAGMLDSLWALGQRLEWEGLRNPFASICQTVHQPGLETAKAAVREIGRIIETQGLPGSLRPFVCGFAGYGNVSHGAQEIFDLLPVVEISPAQLVAGFDGDDRHVYKVVFKEEHLFVPAQAEDRFVLQDYYAHPEKYRSCFEQYLPHLTILMNCIYWEERYPRLVTRRYVDEAFGQESKPRLRVIGDLSCDVEGSVEVTLKATDPGDPVFVYEPGGITKSGVQGGGPVILAVDILPSELPVEASQSFGDVLGPFIPGMLGADFSLPFQDLELPAELKRAVIAHQGKLPPDYQYINKFLGSE